MNLRFLSRSRGSRQAARMRAHPLAVNTINRWLPHLSRPISLNGSFWVGRPRPHSVPRNLSRGRRCLRSPIGLLSNPLQIIRMAHNQGPWGHPIIGPTSRIKRRHKLSRPSSNIRSSPRTNKVMEASNVRPCRHSRRTMRSSINNRFNNRCNSLRRRSRFSVCPVSRRSFRRSHIMCRASSLQGLRGQSRNLSNPLYSNNKCVRMMPRCSTKSLKNRWRLI